MKVFIMVLFMFGVFAGDRSEAQVKGQDGHELQTQAPEKKEKPAAKTEKMPCCESMEKMPDGAMKDQMKAKMKAMKEKMAEKMKNNGGSSSTDSKNEESKKTEPGNHQH